MIKRITIIWFLGTISAPVLHAQPEPVSRMYTAIRQYYSDVESLNRGKYPAGKPSIFQPHGAVLQ